MAFARIIRMSAANFAANDPILEDNQFGVETDLRNGVETGTGKTKLGNGVTRWSELSYWNPGDEIDALTIADGSVSNTEFQYLNGLTGNIQNQLGAISAKIADYPVTAAETGTLFTNEGATGIVIFSLPTTGQVAGTTRFSFAQVSANLLNVDAGTGGTIGFQKDGIAATFASQIAQLAVDNFTKLNLIYIGNNVWLGEAFGTIGEPA
jgi:hypothetical protein